MFAKINHIAIVSENYSQLGRFYESVFGMKPGGKARPSRAVTVGDGHVGLNINPRRAGRRAGLDHFGIQVEDVEVIFARIRSNYPSCRWLERPSTRPFAGLSAHDPDHNVFDLSQREMSNRDAIYTEVEWQQSRYVNHIALRTANPEVVAEFYASVFEFAPLNKAEGDPNHYVSDGRVTLALMPWDITDYEGTGIIGPGIDHIGFKVESVAAVGEEVAEISARNHYLKPMPLAESREGEALLKLFKRSCPLGHAHFTDIDGTLLDYAE